eukprot:CAMPEP_0119094030 /NCGR_PEP_ID=MMETSP1178-20130426/164935_1 /TAXON_ID=33656 /ORGANISM="unid sp, Strain CCMP2000" /LENGTH=169 /DNA_ID=CAMNT_0007077729 /DNA_START=77 /DNA_END=586 /DNA_ORIENTATION=-
MVVGPDRDGLVVAGRGRDVASDANKRTSDCSGIESCNVCAETAGCAFVSGACASGANTGVSVCCDEDLSKAKGDRWLCDDGCNTCSCDRMGIITAQGCETLSAAINEQRSERLDSELVVVALALIPAVLCILACVGIVYLCFCYRRKAKPLPSKELERDEEADQLAAGD